MSMSTHSLLDTETSESRAAIRYFSRLFCFAQFLFNLILMPIDHYIFNPGQQLLNQFVLILFECLNAGNLNIFLPVLHSDGYIYLKRSRQLYSVQTAYKMVCASVECSQFTLSTQSINPNILYIIIKWTRQIVAFMITTVKIALPNKCNEDKCIYMQGVVDESVFRMVLSVSAEGLAREIEIFFFC